tara:strand:+ start:577 stop:804 length:228 start_codon:yes stop_codon:yes gene_type:complete
MNTKIIISNVKEDKKYKGGYARVFRVLNSKSIFTERYETESSIGFINGEYHLEIEGTLDCSEEEEISRIKNVKII